MNVRFVGFDQWQGKFNIGSSTIRCDWVIKQWPEAKRFKFGENPDCIIYQKAYWIDHMKEYKGIKILDICDPDWLEMGSKVISSWLVMSNPFYIVPLKHISTRKFTVLSSMLN